MASTPPSQEQRNRAGSFRPWFYVLVRTALAPLLRGVFRMRVSGVEHVPVTGGVVLAPMHRSNFDSPLVGLGLRRPLRFMAKRELYRFRPMAFVLRNCGVFMVDRGQADTAAVDRAVSLLRAGEIVVVYPEGTRNRRGTIKPRAGAAWLALRAGVPMVPVAVAGTDQVRLWPPRIPRFHARFGPPLDATDLLEVDQRRAARLLTDRWSVAVRRLQAEIPGRREPAAASEQPVS
jgi:1-acyl-sn-glycerol-3-phosphate acyltransferase